MPDVAALDGSLKSAVPRPVSTKVSEIPLVSPLFITLLAIDVGLVVDGAFGFLVIWIT